MVFCYFKWKYLFVEIDLCSSGSHISFQDCPRLVHNTAQKEILIPIGHPLQIRIDARNLPQILVSYILSLCLCGCSVNFKAKETHLELMFFHLFGWFLNIVRRKGLWMSNTSAYSTHPSSSNTKDWKSLRMRITFDE